jgi:hypothetical protein
MADIAIFSGPLLGLAARGLGFEGLFEGSIENRLNEPTEPSMCSGTGPCIFREDSARALEALSNAGGF